MTAVQTIGRVFLAFLELVGQVTMFTLVAVAHCLRPPSKLGTVRPVPETAAHIFHSAPIRSTGRISIARPGKT